MKEPASEVQRRSVLKACAGLVVGSAAATAGAASSPAPTPSPNPAPTPPSPAASSVPASPSPQPGHQAGPVGTGKPGEFDFLAGEWTIKHRRLKTPGPTATIKEWDEFEGEATCWTILAGVGSVEELRIPSRKFAGMGLRLLDVEKKIWSDFWVNAKSGVLTTPGQTGTFENGVGTFGADDMDGDKPIKVKGVWDKITPTSCRWWQAASWDGGKTWEENWVMEWTRVK